MFFLQIETDGITISENTTPEKIPQFKLILCDASITKNNSYFNVLETMMYEIYFMMHNWYNYFFIYL